MTLKHFLHYTCHTYEFAPYVGAFDSEDTTIQVIRAVINVIMEVILLPYPFSFSLFGSCLLIFVCLRFVRPLIGHLVQRFF